MIEVKSGAEYWKEVYETAMQVQGWPAWKKGKPMMDNTDRVQRPENPYGVPTVTGVVTVSAPRRPTVDEIAMAVVAGFQGVLGGTHEYRWAAGSQIFQVIAKRAYAIADAMIAERERREQVR